MSSKLDVAAYLGVSTTFLDILLYREGVERHYKSWTIRKKSGGHRVIQAPTGVVIGLQRKLNWLLQAVYEPKASTQGFVAGRSIVTNAIRHVGRRYVLNVDLENFFPSIHFGRVRGVLMAEPFRAHAPVATVIAQLCCVNGHLPIGAPTSPVIANMICMRLDVELQRLSRRYNVWYTRYADDLSFSTQRRVFPEAFCTIGSARSVHVGAELDAVIRSNGFVVNPLKVRLQGSNQSQRVTGVKVNTRVNVDRRYIRDIRAMLYNWETQGLDACQARFAALDGEDRRGTVPRFETSLWGRISYVAMVRGNDDPVVRRLRAQYDNVASGRRRNALLSAGSTGAGSTSHVVSVLHLSDFHFSSRTSWDSGTMLSKLANFLARQPQRPDLVAVSGDIAQSGQADEYQRAAAWFGGSLLQQLGLERSQLFIVPGNHDVDRHDAGAMFESFCESVRSSTDSDGVIASALGRPNEHALIAARFKGYFDFVRDVTGDDGLARLWWSRELTTAAGHVVHLAGLCSPLLSYTDSEKGKLFLGKYQVNQVAAETDDLAIALLHHPKDYLHDHDHGAWSSLQEWADVVIHGHLHRYDPTSVSTASGSGVVIAGAGAVYQGSSHDNVCQYLSIDLEAKTVAVTPIRWMPEGRWRISSDLARAPLSYAQT